MKNIRKEKKNKNKQTTEKEQEEKEQEEKEEEVGTLHPPLIIHSSTKDRQRKKEIQW